MRNTHLRGLVRSQRVLRSLFPVGASLELGQVAVVVALHLEVEHLGQRGQAQSADNPPSLDQGQSTHRPPGLPGEAPVRPPQASTRTRRLRGRTLLSPVVADGIRLLSRSVRMLVQIWVSSPSTCEPDTCELLPGWEIRRRWRSGTHNRTVLADALHVLVVALLLLLLLDGRNDAPRRAPRADDVLVRHRQEVALLNRQLRLGHLVEERPGGQAGAAPLPGLLPTGAPSRHAHTAPSHPNRGAGQRTALATWSISCTISS